MGYSSEIKQLLCSLDIQATQFHDTLILNPVENIPDKFILEPCTSFLHGLYNTDTKRSQNQKIESKIQFAGRDKITDDINNIYSMWNELLDGEAISMRLLSGLHAHIVLFMSISEIGHKVLALPEKAGGHVSSYAIMKRLGLQVRSIPCDIEHMRVDREKCLEEMDNFKPNLIFVDRSEGLTYEDFTWLGQYKTDYPCYKIFDASQYLTNIISRDYTNPFDMGFDLILSTMHKNLPGPQRALVCAKKADAMWQRLRSGISTYVSNMHVFSIYSAGLLLSEYDNLKILSRNMLENACVLERELKLCHVPVVSRITDAFSPPTHHCWIGPMSKREAFNLYSILEKIGFLTNYRLLPYDIGYGLRLGLSGATKSGLTKQHIPVLAELISTAYTKGYSDALAQNSLALIRKIKESNNDDKKM